MKERLEEELRMMIWQRTKAFRRKRMAVLARRELGRMEKDVVAVSDGEAFREPADRGER